MEQSRCINLKRVLIIVAALLAIALIVFMCTQLLPKHDENTDTSAPAVTEETKKELHLPDLLGTAKAIKGNLMSALEDIKHNHLDSARAKLDTARKDIAAVRTWVEKIPLLVKLVPQAGDLYELLNAADMAIPEVVMPAIDLLETHPISGISVGEGFDTKLLCTYIDFLESVMPKLETLLEAANAVDLSLLDSEGKITEALATANNLLGIYHEKPEILSVIKAMLGGQGDRTYLIAVQNPSEIRAAGGFPGSMSTLRIEAGILTLDDFAPVRNFLPYRAPYSNNITQEERALFTYLSGMQTSWDAELCPDFERVGYIWASAYEYKCNEPVAGVISISPHIVQRILAATNGKIELSDGLVLTPDNAIKVLIHDIYFKYFNRQHMDPNGGVISDQLFAESAKKTMKKLTDNISVTQLLQYLPVFKDSIEDRTLMLWMKDEKEQAFVVDMGWHGGLNRDPQNPEAGVYVNVVSASKMGWFMLMDTEIGERTKNADGSYTYPITVTFSNNITEEEIKSADYYISGGLGGAMSTVAYFFAPAGGSVDNFAATNGRAIKLKTYNGMSLGFMDRFMLKPGEPVTVTYTVTTAPGVDTPLVFSKTPTGQQSYTPS